MAEFSRKKVVDEELKNGDWIFFLDADEEITKKLAIEVAEIITKDLYEI